jgi:hypothetical protein
MVAEGAANMFYEFCKTDRTGVQAISDPRANVPRMSHAQIIHGRIVACER